MDSPQSLNLFDTLANQYQQNIPTVGNTDYEFNDGAGVFTDIVGTPIPLIEDGKFIAEIINTTYAYPSKAAAIADQLNPLAYDINFVRPAHTYSPDIATSRFVNVVGTDPHYSTMYEIIEKMVDMDVYIPIKKKIVANNQGTGVLIIALRGTDTFLQGFMSAGLLLDYTTGSNIAYASHLAAMNAKYNMLETYFTDAAFTGMTKIFVGHSYGGTAALHLSKRFRDAYPLQFAGYDPTTQGWSLPKLDIYEDLACYTINPLYVYDDVMKSIEDECKASYGYRASIINIITRGDAISSPYLTHGVGNCLVSEDIPDTANALYGYTLTEIQTYLEQGISSWVEYTHTYSNHAISQYLIGQSRNKIVPILLPTIEPTNPILLQNLPLLANGGIQTKRTDFYDSAALVGGVPMELHTYHFYDPILNPLDIFRAGKLHTDAAGNIVDDLTYYNFCLRGHPTDGIRYYHIYDIDEWRYNEELAGQIVRNPPSQASIVAEYGYINRTEVKYYTQPLELINLHDAAQPRHNRITIMRKYHDTLIDIFLASYVDSNALTFLTAPQGDTPGTAALPRADVLTQNKITFVNQLLPASTMTPLLEERKTWVLNPPLTNSQRHSINLLFPPSTATQLTHQLFQNIVPSNNQIYNFQIWSYAYPTFYVQQSALTATTIGDYKHFLAIAETWSGKAAYPKDTWTFTYNSITSKFVIANYDTDITPNETIYLGRMKQDDGVYNQPGTEPINWYQDNTRAYSDEFEVEFVSNAANNDFIFKISQSGSSLQAIASTWTTIIKSMIFDVSPTTTSLTSPNNEFYFILKNPNGSTINWTAGSGIP